MTTALAVDDKCARPGCRHSIYVHELKLLKRSQQKIRAKCTHTGPSGLPCTCPEFTPAHERSSNADA